MSPSMSKRAAVWPVIVLLLSPFLGGAGSSLVGQDGPDRFRIQTRAQARAYDNFFRSSDPAEARTIFAWTGEARVALRPVVSPVIELYGKGDFTRYETLGDSRGAGAGVYLWSPTHVARFEADYQEGRPVFDVGDVTRFANLFVISGHYSFRPGSRWRFDLDGRTVHVRFDEIPQANSRVHLGGGSVRFRVSDFFQPELGGRIGLRDAGDPDQNNTRGQVSLGLFSALADPFWVNVEYRLRSRWYTGDDVTARNFERLDEGGQWMVSSSVRASSHVRFHLFYNRMDMDSTLEERIYQSQSVTLGVTLQF